MCKRRLEISGIAFILTLLLLVSVVQGQSTASLQMTPRQVYKSACATCHGSDGKGAAQSQVGFDDPLPDFTDCSFATREPDADWIAVSHEGGPVRGFSRMMPAFGEALTEAELQLALNHIRTFCADKAWPRGELNLPRALVTEKAYPEDEAVFTTTIQAEGRGAVMNEILYEKRIGARGQVEFALPFGWRKQLPQGPGALQAWTGNIGDVAIAYKRVLFHNLGSGSIISLSGEVILPTGEADEGFGSGVTIFEPFVTYGQLLPADGFLQFQGGVELPTNTDTAQRQAFWRTVLGKSFTQNRWGRTWSPMVEALAQRELVGGESTQWDLLPQVQVTLNTRQHVMLNAGVRFPLNERGTRDTQILIYLLWDWFDGGFTEGW